jgi:hypothetical protein
VLRILRWACWQLRLILTLLTARTRADFSLRLLPVHISLPPREPLPLNLSLILHSGIHSNNRRNPPPRAIYSRRSPGNSINKGHLPSAPSARSPFGQLSRLAAAAWQAPLPTHSPPPAPRRAGARLLAMSSPTRSESASHAPFLGLLSSVHFHEVEQDACAQHTKACGHPKELLSAGRGGRG